MKAHIFAEGSNTTAEDQTLPLKEYYEGLFGIVAGLHDELESITDAELHILSEEFGVANGTESLSSLVDGQHPVGFDTMVEAGQDQLLTAASDADVMVILLSTDVFDATVPEVWDELVEAAKPGSIWCLSAARSSLESLEIEKLESKGCTVLTYQRVGVARIGSDTRDELLETVKQKATQ